MDITKAKSLLTNSLDSAEKDNTLSYTDLSKIRVSFGSTPGHTSVLLFVYPDGTFTIGRSETAREDEFLGVSDAYTRAAAFIRAASLKP